MLSMPTRPATRAWVQAAQRLCRDAELRFEQRAMLLGGHTPVSEFLAAGGRPTDIAVTAAYLSSANSVLGTAPDFNPQTLNSLEECSYTHKTIITMSAHTMTRITGEQAPDGIVAIVPIPSRVVRDVYERRDDNAIDDSPSDTVIVCSPRQPGNVGALVRTAFALGWRRVIVHGTEACDPLSHPSVRASRGAIMDAFLSPEYTLARRRLFPRNILNTHRVVAALAPEQRCALPEYTPRTTDSNCARPLALVVGSESRGIPPDVLAMCHQRITLPTLRSLNLAVASGILMHILSAK